MSVLPLNLRRKCCPASKTTDGHCCIRLRLFFTSQCNGSCHSLKRKTKTVALTGHCRPGGICSRRRMRTRSPCLACCRGGPFVWKAAMGVAGKGVTSGGLGATHGGPNSGLLEAQTAKKIGGRGKAQDRLKSSTLPARLITHGTDHAQQKNK